jgi:hypothetical protein
VSANTPASLNDTLTNSSNESTLIHPTLPELPNTSSSENNTLTDSSSTPIFGNNTLANSSITSVSGNHALTNSSNTLICKKKARSTSSKTSTSRNDTLTNTLNPSTLINETLPDSSNTSKSTRTSEEIKEVSPPTIPLDEEEDINETGKGEYSSLEDEDIDVEINPKILNHYKSNWDDLIQSFISSANLKQSNDSNMLLYIKNIINLLF